MTGLDVSQIDKVLTYLGEFQAKALALAKTFDELYRDSDKRFISFEPYGYFGPIPSGYCLDRDEIGDIFLDSGVTFLFESYVLTIGIRYWAGNPHVNGKRLKLLPILRIGHNNLFNRRQTPSIYDTLNSLRYSNDHEKTVENVLKLIENNLTTNNLSLLAAEEWRTWHFWNTYPEPDISVSENELLYDSEAERWDKKV